jgi:hypothetical protein
MMAVVALFLDLCMTEAKALNKMIAFTSVIHKSKKRATTAII